MEKLLAKLKTKHFGFFVCDKTQIVEAVELGWFNQAMSIPEDWDPTYRMFYASHAAPKTWPNKSITGFVERWHNKFEKVTFVELLKRLHADDDMILLRGVRVNPETWSEERLINEIKKVTNGKEPNHLPIRSR